MLMADTMAILLTVLGFMLAFPALWLVCRGLWGPTVERASRRCARNPIKCFIVGALSTLLVVVPVTFLAQAGPGGVFLGTIIGGLFAAWAHLGVAGLVTHLGRQLPSPADDKRPWKATLRGGIALELTYLLPILGWFGILPLSWIYGAGATTLGLLDRLIARFSAPAHGPAADRPPLLTPDLPAAAETTPIATDAAPAIQGLQ